MPGAAIQSGTTTTDGANRLTSGNAVERRIAGGERHTFVVRLRAGEFIDLEARSGEIDLDVSIVDPRGVLLARVAHRQGAMKSVRTVAPVSADYRVRVATLEAADAQGVYYLFGADAATRNATGSSAHPDRDAPG